MMEEALGCEAFQYKEIARTKENRLTVPIFQQRTNTTVKLYCRALCWRR